MHALTWDQARRESSSAEQRRGWKKNKECDNIMDEVRSSLSLSRRTQKKITSQALEPSLAPPTLANNFIGNLLIEKRSSDDATNYC
jgi:hypothetical protein